MNPYQSPRGEDFQEDRADQDESAIDRILVRIHHLVGINLLGVLLPLFGLGLGAAAFSLSEFTMQSVPPWLAFLAAWILPLAADLAWRHLRNPGYDYTRFLYPFAGAALGYVPLWIWYAALPAIVVALAVFHK